jgi:glyoxylase-like metal-dependent hydrolase (beta-lactamase superfamily II)
VTHPLYFRQLLAGRDFGRNHPVCGQMANFVYLVGDRDRGECVIIDPAWAVDDIVDAAEHDGMKVVGGFGTHYHPDHVGGSMMGFNIEGAGRLLERCGCPVHVHRADAEFVQKVTGLPASALTLRDGGDKVAIGAIEIEWMHTPGHTPGSCCFRVNGALVSGDTLFLQGCGRTDLPGGDPAEMRRTLSQRFSALADDTVIFPGHNYGGPKAPLGVLRKSNPVFDPRRAAQMLG